MKAIVFDRFGPPDVLTLVELPTPEPGRGEVVVRVRASGVNPADTARRMRPRRGPALEFPAHPGWDLVGEIVAIDRRVRGFEVGDRVYGMARFPELAGTLAEFAAVPAKQLALAPTTLSDAEAGAVPLVGLTALQAFNRGGGITPRSRVMIDNGAGGVGHIAIQLAKAMGAHVITTASAHNIDFVRGLGADRVVDYAASDVFADLPPLDFILHSRGKEWAPKAFAALASGGSFVSITNATKMSQEVWMAGNGLTIGNHLVAPDPDSLTRLAALIDGHHLRVVIDSQFPLEHAAQAHARVETGHVAGKVVVTI